MNEQQVTEPRYPDVVVELLGHDSNAFAVLGTVERELRRHLRADESISATERDRLLGEFMGEATSGDYDHLLQTCMSWVNVE